MDTLDRLLKTVSAVLGDDQMFILRDDTNDHQPTIDIIHDYGLDAGVAYYGHKLENDYGGHKNFGIERCKGDFIFQIDGDEMPPDSLLGENLHALLESNPSIEAYAVPRMNDFRGVTEDHAKQWGWKLTYNARPDLNDKVMGPLVNWPDYQWRIFKRDYPRISFTRRLHEKIEGYETHVVLPMDEEWAIYHDKTIETQIKTNLRYNQMFSQDENKGHNVFK